MAARYARVVLGFAMLLWLHLLSVLLSCTHQAPSLRISIDESRHVA
jgi:hypothetical protein